MKADRLELGEMSKRPRLPTSEEFTACLLRVMAANKRLLLLAQEQPALKESLAHVAQSMSEVCGLLQGFSANQKAPNPDPEEEVKNIIAKLHNHCEEYRLPVLCLVGLVVKQQIARSFTGDLNQQAREIFWQNIIEIFKPNVN